MKVSIIILSLFVLLGFSSCSDKTSKVPCVAPLQTGIMGQKICGVSLTAMRNQIVKDPMEEMAAINANWVTFLPYNIFQWGTGHIEFDTGNWYGETTEGVSHCKNLATAQSMKTMIKPQLWSRDGWIGDVNFPLQTQWDSFHMGYTNFMCYWAHIADSLDVDMLCIGTEIKYSTTQYPNYWRALIDTIKTIYSGPLTYAPNWDEYDQITFWDKLDYIGCDAYFSLVPDKTPSVCDLKTAWEPIFNNLKAFSEQWNKPILFTEWGYLSLDGCAYETWELEKNRSAAVINEQAQANAAQALLELFGKETWWAGGFQWKWYADLELSSRDYSDDYTPQGKACEAVLKALYQP